MRAITADDDPVTTAILSRALTGWGFDVACANDGISAWQLLTSDPVPELAILDWMMPGIDGIEICRQIRQQPSLAAMYVVLLSGRGGRGDLVEGLDAGADDYMIKPIDAEELRARVHVGTRVATLQRRLAEQVNELRTAREHLTHLVSTDVLTNVYSRRWWFELAATEFSRCRRYKNPFSVMVIDIDFFKRVNDTFGHDVGDTLLRRFADMLRGVCRQPDVIGRIGGEEFALLAPETTLATAERFAERINASCRNLSVPSPTGDVRCSCSIGISEIVPEDQSIDSVLRRADAALYEAKRAGRDRWKSQEQPVPVG